MTQIITQPQWLWTLLGCETAPAEGTKLTCNGKNIRIDDGIPRAQGLVSESQAQTRQTFGFKWAKRETFQGEVTRYMQQWLQEKYGDMAEADWLADHGPCPLVLDAGCGAAMSGLALFKPVLSRIRYLGVDVSSAVDVAARRFSEQGFEAGFMQADLMQLPLPPESVDIIFSEGVLHHTDNTQAALRAVVSHLKPGGRILFYVYRKKGPIREFTDDYVREKMQLLRPEEGWEAMQSLSRFGQMLGELDVDIDIPEPIDLLEIPAGKISLQRFFYWHVCKAFYRPGMSLDEMNHINFDWFAPKNAHRQSVAEVRSWCSELGLHPERENLEEAGITIIARKAF